MTVTQGPGVRPEPAPQRTVEVAPREKNSAHIRPENEICALDECSEPVVPRKRGGSRKRFCSERCQRIAERRRYRARHTEQATCRREGCGQVFERNATTNRKQVFCSPGCMSAARSVEYAGRPDILAGIGEARRAAAPGSGHARPRRRST